MRVLHVAAGVASDGRDVGEASWFRDLRVAEGEGGGLGVLAGSDDLQFDEVRPFQADGDLQCLLVGTGGARGEAGIAPLVRRLREQARAQPPDTIVLHGSTASSPALLAEARALAEKLVLSVDDAALVCARGSGVDSSGRCCAIAVTPGSCACAEGTIALERRNAELREALREADQVVAATPSLAARLSASGVPARVRVRGSVPDSPAVAEAEALRAEVPAWLRHVLLITGVARGAPLHYRVHQKVEQLRLAGVGSTVRNFTDPRLAADVERADAVIVYRAPATPELLRLIDRAQRRGAPTFYDVDDLIFDPDRVADLPIHENRSAKEVGIWVENARRCQAVLRACGRGIVSTPELARQMRRLGVPVDIHPNGVDTVLLALSEGARRLRPQDPGRPLTIAYCSGTDTHDSDLALIGEVLAEFLAEHRDARLVLGGPLERPAALRRQSRVEVRPLVGRQEFVRWFADFDLNLAPLVEHTFTECKSSIKWSEAALVEVPTLASDTEPFRASIVDRRTGLLASTLEDFLEGLRWAAEDRDRLRDVGRRARETASVTGSPWRLGADLVRILTTSTVSEPATPSAATPVARWPTEVDIPDVELPGLVGGQFPVRPRPRPAQPLSAGPVEFALPDSTGMGPLRQVEVMVATWLEAAAGPVELVARQDGLEVEVAGVPPELIRDNLWISFEFTRGVPAGARITLELRSAGGGNVAPYVMPHGRRSVAGRERRGMVVVKTYYELPVPPRFAPLLAAPCAGQPFDTVAGRARWLATDAAALGRRLIGSAKRRLLR